MPLIESGRLELILSSTHMVVLYVTKVSSTHCDVCIFFISSSQLLKFIGMASLDPNRVCSFADV